MNEKKYLGIDIGGTSAKHSIVYSSGKIENQSSFKTGLDLTKEEFLKRLDTVINNAVKLGIEGIGISTLGVVNTKTGEILGGVANLPILKNANLIQEIHKKHADLPISVCNDAHAMALGEHWLGAGKDCDNFYCIAFGTGLGGCAVVNSKVLSGAHFRAGEIGYLDYKDKYNYCEHQLSTIFVTKQAAKLLGKELNGIEFFNLVRKGDKICLEIFDKWINNISRLIANIIIHFDPEKVILGGGISSEGDFLLSPIQEKISKMLPSEFVGQTKIETAKCKNNAGILGAVYNLLSTNNCKEIVDSEAISYSAYGRVCVGGNCDA
jgi:glucokinase